MTEQQLIKQLQELRNIKPTKEWASLTKIQILGEEEKSASFISVFRFFFLKPAYTGVLAVLAIVGLLGVSQNSLPGDPLYSIKKLTEKSQAVFVPAGEKTNFQFKLTNERLSELAQIVQANQVAKLSPALKEFNTTKVVARQELVDSMKGKSTEEAIEIAKKIAPELQAMNEKEAEVLASLQLESEKETAEEPAEKTVVEFLLKDLEGANLTGEKAELLAQAKADFETGNYWKALENILLLSNQ